MRRAAARRSPRTYVWQLREGAARQPDQEAPRGARGLLRRLAGVFFDDAAAARIDAELELLAALRDAGVRELALRAYGLSPASLTTLGT